MAASVRPLESHEELVAGARIDMRQMLGDLSDDVVTKIAEIMRGRSTHGAFEGDELVGLVQWFPSELATPGLPVPTAGVTSVSVLSNHRRRGHLTRMIEEQLRDIRARGNPTAILIAAEYPIYGRFGYGPATRACGVELDTKATRFRDEPTGTITMVDFAALRPALEAAYEARQARTPGALSRDSSFWDHVACVAPWPGNKRDLGKVHAALWHDDAGALGGAVVYDVTEEWTRNRPDGKAEVDLLVGATPEAERELWRHLTTLDWIGTVTVRHGRSVEEPLPLLLHDARTAPLIDHSDHVWARILDVPAALGARRTAVAGAAVLEVVDPFGYANGRWQVELGPDGASVTTTTAAADVRLPVSSLGAAYLGGHTLVRLAEVGLAEELRPGRLGPASALLATPTAPWCPLNF